MAKKTQVLKPYSVLLLRPCDDTGTDTYYAHVTARGVKTAVAAARREASASDDDIYIPNCYVVLCITAGHNEDLNTGRL